MTPSRLPEHERLLQLLADRATEGLADADRRELEALLREHPTVPEDALDAAAAAVDLAAGEARPAPLPAALRDRIAAGARAHFAGGSAAGPAARPPFEELHDAARPMPRGARGGDRTIRVSWPGWLAAAAAIVLAVAGWWPRLQSVREIDRVREIVMNAPDRTRAVWSGAVDEFKGVAGEVVWSDARQAGYLRLAGMPVNDPSKAQYQLWIVDPARDKNPIDGGVFDVASSGEVLIPIDAKLAVNKPAVFAITREKPGGVVVSAGPLLVVAKPATS